MDLSNPEFSAIAEKMTQLVGQSLREAMGREEIIAEFKKINQLMLEKFDHVFANIMFGVTYTIVKVEGEPGQTISRQPEVNVNFDVASGDGAFLKGLGIDAGPGELEEIEKDLRGAREKEPTPPVSTEGIGPKLEIGEIINNIRTMARHLDPDSRLRAAKKINSDQDSRYWDVQFPEDESLKNDRIWLNCIQQVINGITKHSGDKEKIEKSLREFTQLLISAAFNE